MARGLHLRCSRIQIWPKSLVFLPSRIIWKSQIMRSRLNILPPVANTRRESKGFKASAVFCKSNGTTLWSVSGTVLNVQANCIRPITAKPRYVKWWRALLSRIRPDSRKVPTTMAAPTMDVTWEPTMAISVPWSASPKAAMVITDPEKVVAISFATRQATLTNLLPGFLNTSRPTMALTSGPTKKKRLLPTASESLPPSWFACRLRAPTKAVVRDNALVD
mmetsp:Transcript_59663/g.177529  ORF Transcript_59663/g.177529 Transcript_59663/m.177529 type:complete len:220 (-) Transcript_59663:192-851(-)